MTRIRACTPLKYVCAQRLSHKFWTTNLKYVNLLPFSCLHFDMRARNAEIHAKYGFNRPRLCRRTSISMLPRNHKKLSTKEYSFVWSSTTNLSRYCVFVGGVLQELYITPPRDSLCYRCIVSTRCYSQQRVHEKSPPPPPPPPPPNVEEVTTGGM